MMQKRWWQTRGSSFQRPATCKACCSFKNPNVSNASNSQGLKAVFGFLELGIYGLNREACMVSVPPEEPKT